LAGREAYNVVQHPTDILEVGSLEVDVRKGLHPDAQLLDTLGSDQWLEISVSEDEDTGKEQRPDQQAVLRLSGNAERNGLRVEELV
jgi:hypothetical protein